MVDPFGASGTGPSPLARGKHDKKAPTNVAQGTIPARAGETRTLAPSFQPMGDHPRSRGGNLDIGADGGVGEGPSPLARGKRRRCSMSALLNGTIPARAGETQAQDGIDCQTEDHPRSRGGNCPPCCSAISSGGPSPLARGKLRHCAEALLLKGTIPARAGETDSYRLRAASFRDHPRSRGGNRACACRMARSMGPSPLARGKRSPRSRCRLRTGTIPARAGETVLHLAAGAVVRDHPRSRGGNALSSYSS